MYVLLLSLGLQSPQYPRSELFCSGFPLFLSPVTNSAYIRQSSTTQSAAAVHQHGMIFYLSCGPFRWHPCQMLHLSLRSFFSVREWAGSASV